MSSSFDFPGSLLHSSSSSCSRAQSSPPTGKKGSDDPAFRGFEAKAGHEKSFLEWMAPAAGQLSASSEKGWDVASIATCHGPRQVSFHAGSLAKQQAGLARVALMSDDPRAVIVRSAETSTRRPTARSPSAPWMPLPWNEQRLPACRRPCVCVTRHAAGPESGATVRAEVVDNCPATGVRLVPTAGLQPQPTATATSAPHQLSPAHSTPALHQSACSLSPQPHQRHVSFSIPDLTISERVAL